VSHTTDPDVLDSIAASISDGAAVPWEHVAQQVGGDADAVVDQLRELERIAKFYRDAEEPDPGEVAEGENESPSPGAWAHFVILGQLGQGSSGDVYRAHDTKLQCDVALKLIRHDGDSAARMSRVLKEARLLARVRHSNVVAIYGADQIDGRVGLWMELVRGITLEDALQRQGPFGAREASLIGLDLCRAIAAVHRAGLLHGDIKAHNVMREEGGRTVLMDFGVGRDLDQQVPRAQLGASADFAGTPLYLAPEVFSGSRRTRVADVYSLGVLLFHLVSNRYPVEGDTRAAVDEAHQQKVRTHLRDLRPDLPEEFVSVVERAVDPDPRQRFQSAGAFEIALARFLGTSAESDAAEPRRVVPALLATVVAAILLGAPIYWFALRPRIAPAAPAPVAVASEPSASISPGSYRIDAGLYRVSEVGESRLRPGDRVAPGDRLAMQIELSQPAHVYVVNEDDSGESYLLFPLPNQNVTNPIPAGHPVRLPTGGDTPLYWTVTSAGGHEHFVIFATPEPLPGFDRMFASLPHPQLNAPVVAAPLTTEAVGGLLRGVGGLTKSPRPTGNKLAEQFTAPLLQTPETANGLWVRQITLENPGR
jgi:serine/threonine protein kinase